MSQKKYFMVNVRTNNVSWLNGFKINMLVSVTIKFVSNNVGLYISHSECFNYVLIGAPIIHLLLIKFRKNKEISLFIIRFILAVSKQVVSSAYW